MVGWDEAKMMLMLKPQNIFNNTKKTKSNGKNGKLTKPSFKLFPIFQLVGSESILRSISFLLLLLIHFQSDCYLYQVRVNKDGISFQLLLFSLHRKGYNKFFKLN